VRQLLSTAWLDPQVWNTLEAAVQPSLVSYKNSLSTKQLEFMFYFMFFRAGVHFILFTLLGRITFAKIGRKLYYLYPLCRLTPDPKRN